MWEEKELRKETVVGKGKSIGIWKKVAVCHIAATQFAERTKKAINQFCEKWTETNAKKKKELYKKERNKKN